MPVTRILIANRGEIAIRIARAAAELGSAHGRRLLRGRRALAAHAAARTTRDALARRGRGRLPRRRRSSSAVARGRGLRRDPPRLRLPERERGLRARLRRVAGIALRRAAAGDARAVRRQGAARGRSPQRCGVPVLPGTGGPTSLDEARAFLASLRRRRGDDQGDRRRRRARHARRRSARTSSSRRLRALPVGGAARLRQRRRVRRGAARRARGTSRCRSSATAPARSCHLWERDCSSSGGTRSWSRSRRPGPRAGRCATRLLDGGGAARRRRLQLRRPRHRSSSWSTPTPAATRALRLHRGQPAAAGRAHRDRGGDRHRPGADAAPAGRGAHARRARARAGRHPPRRAASRSRRGSTRRRCGADGSAQPTGGTLARVRAAVRAGRARRHVRLRRLHDQPALRLAARRRSSSHSASPEFADVLARACARARASSASRASATNLAVPAEPAARARSSSSGGVYTRFVDEHVAELVAAAGAIRRASLLREHAGATAARRSPARGSTRAIRWRCSHHGKAQAGDAPTPIAEADPCPMARSPSARRCRARS